MSGIAKVTCGRINSDTEPADFYELTVSGDIAELVHYSTDQQTTLKVDGVLLQTALQKIERMLAMYPDEAKLPETAPFTNEILFQDGTVKYAPKDKLTNLMKNISFMRSPQNIQMVGPFSARPAPANGFIGMLFPSPNNAQTDPPRLQGLVTANPPEHLPQQPAGTVNPQAWICPVCNAENGGKFCSNCGSPKPQNG